MPLVPEPKSPLTSKIILSALSIFGANAAMLPSVLDHAPEIVAAVQPLVPPQYVLIFNMVVSALVAAFRVWSSGAPIEAGGEFRIRK